MKNYNNAWMRIRRTLAIFALSVQSLQVSEAKTHSNLETLAATWGDRYEIADVKPVTIIEEGVEYLYFVRKSPDEENPNFQLCRTEARGNQTLVCDLEIVSELAMENGKQEIRLERAGSRVSVTTIEGAYFTETTTFIGNMGPGIFRIDSIYSESNEHGSGFTHLQCASGSRKCERSVVNMLDSWSHSFKPILATPGNSGSHSSSPVLGWTDVHEDEFVVFGKKNWTGPKDLSFRSTADYSKDSLTIILEIQDERITFAPNSPNPGLNFDHVEVWIDSAPPYVEGKVADSIPEQDEPEKYASRPNLTKSRSLKQFGIFPTTEDGKTILVQWQPKGRSDIAGIRAQTIRIKDGYSVRITLPIDRIRFETPMPSDGATLSVRPITLCISDNDDPKSTKQETMMANAGKIPSAPALHSRVIFLKDANGWDAKSGYFLNVAD